MDAALPRTMAKDMRSVSHAVSLLLPVQADTCLPSFWMKALVEGPNTPVTSTATGSNMYLSVMHEYLALLFTSAAAAADPGVIAELITELLQNVLTQVASHAKHLILGFKLNYFFTIS